MSSTRHLAAIMFVDIMGYTAIMEKDEALAIQLRDKLKKKLESEVVLRGGRILKMSGDGALCSFDSALEATKAAIDVQVNMQAEPVVPLRIGLHQADVIFEESDVYGDGVNIAARLESFAIPGSIFISSKVFDDIKNQKDIQAVSLGKYSLKNVKDPVEIYAISNPGLQVPGKKKLEGKGVKYADRKSLKNLTSFFVKRVMPLLALVILGFIFIPTWLKKQNARNKLLPAIQKLVDETFRPPTQAFDMAIEAQKYIPGDSALLKLWPTVSTAVSMETKPSGAAVYWKDYDKPNSEWRLAGTTPFKNLKFPRTYLRIEIRKKSFQTIEYAGPRSLGKLGPDIANLKLDSLGSLPENMVRIPSKVALMELVGLQQYQ